MNQFYNTLSQYFYLFFTWMFFLALPGKAQTPFLVKGQCMQNPDCATDSTTFSDTLSTAVAWQWSFGGLGTDTRRIAQYSYATAGTYNVTLTRTLRGGATETVTQSVNIGELPPAFQKWKADTTICRGDSLVLDPYPNGAPSGAKYIWYPKGDTTQTLKVDSSGCYSVEVILPNGCKIQDKVNVKICMEPLNQEGAKWYFGANAGLDFSSGNPTPLTDGKVNTPEGVSTISNSQGKLLFYSDGIKVWNRDGEEMTCANGPCPPLKGSATSTQSVLIVPQPTCRGCEYLYNVITTTEINGEKVLSLSVVDMRRNNGKGAIIEQNTKLQQPTTERLASVRNDRDTTYWVISHDYGTNQFRIFHATPGGLVETSAPTLGMPHDTPEKAQGYMKFSSPDSTTGQRKLAVVVPGPPNNFVELFSFNDSTGTLTHSKTIDLGPAPPTAYGVEFSPSGEKMYVSFQGDGNGAKSYLKQYDLTFPDSLLVETAITIDSSSTEKYGALQFASNGKIYMAIDGSEYLAEIGNPEGNSIRGIEYEREGAFLGGKKSTLGLPNGVQDFTQESTGAGFEADGFCTNEPTTFSSNPLCDPMENSYSWDFLGNGSFTPPSKEQQQATFTYTKAGIYNVGLTIYIKDCADTTVFQQIEIFDTPLPVDLGPDKDTCGAYVPLKINVPAQGYIWMRRGRIISRQQEYRATATGDYIGIAYNGPDADCYTSDTIKITFRRPPAFSIGPDTTMCRDSSIMLMAPSSPWIEFKWSTGETSKEIKVSAPGTYSVVVKDRNDCYNSDTLLVSELPSPILNLQSEYVICIPDGGRAILDARGIGNLKYVWQPSGDSTQTITVNKEGVYQVTGTNQEGCSTARSTQVVDKCEPRILVPDAFTPDQNGPKENETLQIFGAYYTKFKMQIFDRWGEVIFATNSSEDRWDGTYKGLKVQPGVYPYVISYEAFYFPERNPVIKRGSVMVIR